MPSFINRIQHAWNAFRGRDRPAYKETGSGSYYRPDRHISTMRGVDKSIVTSVINRMAVDAASVTILHARVDENGNYLDVIRDGLNECLTLDANIDQTALAFKIDLVRALLSEGNIAAVPIDTTLDPSQSASYDIHSIRVGRITQWFPQYVRVQLYNDKTGYKEELTLPKRMVAIVENPFNDIMNEPNSTLQRLIRKLSLMDSVDEQINAGKLDLIIQLPYVIKSQARQEQAERRRKEIEMQLRGSKYGIAYTDGTEKIVQLNRPLENNLLSQIEYLTNQLYSQLGITPEILNGTASEDAMVNYYNRTIEPILTAIVDEFKRKFLTKTARTQGQSILFLRDHFKLVTLGKIAEIADSFTRNEILSSNEVRAKLGFKPSDNPRADELVNKNINPMDLLPPESGTSDENQNGSEQYETQQTEDLPEGEFEPYEPQPQ